MVSCIPVVGQIAATGYVMSIVNSAVESDEERELPDWSELMEHFGQGMMPSLIGVLYMLAGLIPMSIVWMSSFFIYGMKASMDKGFQPGYGGMLLGAIAGVVAFVLFLGIYSLLPMAFAYYAQTGDFAGCFRFQELLARIQTAPGEWLKIVAVSSIPVLLWAGLSFVPGGVWKQIPAMLVGFYCWVVAARMAGQLAREKFAMPQRVQMPIKPRREENIPRGELVIDSSKDVGSLEDLI